MGLDASVMCNCFRDGKTTDPPFPRDWFEGDEDGYLSLKPRHLPVEGSDNEDDWSAFWIVRDWQETCCEHPGMEQANERIGNWASCRYFKQAMQEIGAEHFPTLLGQIPTSNGGIVTPAQSNLAVAELNRFTNTGVFGEKTALVVSHTNDELHSYIAAYGGIFLWSGSTGLNVGIDTDGIFAIHRETERIVFQAKRMRQFSPYGRPLSRKLKKVVWENLDTNDLYNADIAITGHQIPWDNGKWKNSHGRSRFEYPSELHMEKRPWHTDEFDYIVGALKSVFSASIKAGNPVRWC